jgi:hypothetical protein
MPENKALIEKELLLQRNKLWSEAQVLAQVKKSSMNKMPSGIESQTILKTIVRRRKTRSTWTCSKPIGFST